jgi:hypothetical protein
MLYRVIVHLASLFFFRLLLVAFFFEFTVDCSPSLRKNLLRPLDRIDVLAVRPRAPMQMWSGCKPCTAHFADQISLLHHLPYFNRNGRLVEVRGEYSQPVVDYHQIPSDLSQAGKDNRSAGVGVNWVANLSSKIGPIMPTSIDTIQRAEILGNGAIRGETEKPFPELVRRRLVDNIRELDGLVIYDFGIVQYFLHLGPDGILFYRIAGAYNVDSNILIRAFGVRVRLGKLDGKASWFFAERDTDECEKIAFATRKGDRFVFDCAGYRGQLGMGEFDFERATLPRGQRICGGTRLDRRRADGDADHLTDRDGIRVREVIELLERA